jgi:hypothetical protein
MPDYFMVKGGRATAALAAGADAGAAADLVLPSIEMPIDHCVGRIEAIKTNNANMAKTGIDHSDKPYYESEAFKHSCALSNSYTTEIVEMLQIQNQWQSAVPPAARASATVAKAKTMAVKAGMEPDKAFNAADQKVADTLLNTIKSELSDNPALADSQQNVTSKGKAIDLKRRQVQTAATYLRALIIGEMKSEVDQEKKDNEKKKQELEEKIEGVVNTMSTITNALNTAMSFGMAGEAIKLGKEGASQIKNFGATEEADAMDPGAHIQAGFDSAKGVAETAGKMANLAAEAARSILEWHYEEPLNQLKTAIAAAESQIGKLSELQSATTALAARQMLGDAVDAYGLAIGEYQAAVQARQNAYMKVAQRVDQLLNQGKSLAPGSQKDRAGEMMITDVAMQDAKQEIELAENAVAPTSKQADAFLSNDRTRGEQLVVLADGTKAFFDNDSPPHIAAVNQVKMLATNWMAAAKKERSWLDRASLDAVRPKG